MKELVLLVTKTSLWIISSFFISIPALAQEAPITADGTTSTTITTPDGSNFNINDGDKAGGNLFHSFGNFSVSNGGSANFLNSADIQNIISRVTGGNISNIEGLIKANGSANLFLINPAGIIFGPNASLNIGGSFLGSTANSLKFPEGEFVATNKEGKPLLTINAPIGLGIRDNPGNIVNNAALQVNPGQNITLVGGNINLDDGKIIAPGGRVELGSLASAGTVGFNSNGSLSFPKDSQRGDVTLNNGALVDVSAGGGGSIAVNARNVNLSGGSKLLAGIAANQGKPEAKGGDIAIDATNTIFVDGSNAPNTPFTEEQQADENDRTKSNDSRRDVDRTSISTGVIGTGKAGNIDITAKNLSLTNGGQVAADNYGRGDAGEVKINANDTINVDGDRSAYSGFIGITSSVSKKGTGQSGLVDITTKNLSVTNAGYVGSNNLGDGNAGEVKINANDTINVDGNSQKNLIFSGIGSVGSGGATGNGGLVNLKTKNLFISNLGQVGAATFKKGNAGTVNINASDRITIDGSDTTVFDFGISSSISSGVGIGVEGNAGDININSKNLFITKGGQISNLIFGGGDGGTIAIRASDNIFIDGRPNNVSSGILSQVNAGGKGNAGDINITAKNLSITNGGQIGTIILGEGNAAGNIKLNFTGVLSLRNGGSISARATGTANGGNIDINAPDGFIVATSNQDNDLIATAQQGEGGKININAIAIYGFDKARFQTNLSSEERNNILKNGKNDINSTSDSGKTPSDRTLDINFQTLDTSARLPTNIVQPDRVVSQACSASATTTEGINSFTIIGRGGMPADPTKPLNSSVLAGNLTADVRGEREEDRVILTSSEKPLSSDEIIPARGAIVNQKGQVVLTRYPTSNTTQRNIAQVPYCNG
jgi:filamentous hemagglutinin family protein